MKNIKKFNYILITVVSLITLYIAFFGNIERTLYKYLIVFSIIPVMLLPYILKKLFKLKLDDATICLYLLFVFFAHFLGTIIDLYYRFPIYDKLMHTLSGIMTSFLAVILLVKLKKYDNKSIAFNIIYIIAITSTVALLWEIFEFTNDNIFDRDAQRVLTTGVNDTMTDMIVAFLGSCAFSVLYAFEKICKKEWIIINYIKQIQNKK